MNPMQPTTEPSSDLLAEFVTRARNMAAIVTLVSGENEVVDYLLKLCAEKKNGGDCLVAAPGLGPETFQMLAAACREHGLGCICILCPGIRKKESRQICSIKFDQNDER